MVQQAEQVHGPDACVYHSSEIEAEQRAVFAMKGAVHLLVSTAEQVAAAIKGMPAAKYNGQRQPGRASAHDDNGMVFGCGHEISWIAGDGTRSRAVKRWLRSV